VKKVTLLIGTVLSFWFLLPGGILAQAYYYPMDRYFERQGVKGFGQQIDNNFYQGKESLFPFNRFYGYHTGIDLEISKGEEDKKVPVYAIAQGNIVYIGNLSGYGGVILERIEGENETVLYGHVKITNLPIKTGDQVS
jgi:murein DD-endopeptidase MepM/ murein hydrolase activator NlpD